MLTRDPRLFTPEMMSIDPAAELAKQGFDPCLDHLIQQLRVQAVFENAPQTIGQLILLLAADELERLSIPCPASPDDAPAGTNRTAGAE